MKVKIAWPGYLLRSYGTASRSDSKISLGNRVPTDYTQEDFAYAQKVSWLQSLNFVFPHLLGIDWIKVGKDFALNFALRHYLTSFGHHLERDLFLQIKDKNILLTWHGYHKKDQFFPGVEPQLIDLPLKLSAMTLPTMLWLQPDNQTFFTNKGQAGRCSLPITLPLGKTW